MQKKIIEQAKSGERLQFDEDESIVIKSGRELNRNFL